MNLRVAAIITTFRPDEGFRARIDAIVRRCDATIVVDNTPGKHRFQDTRGLAVCQDGVNKGLGRALNIGIEQARQRGCNAVVLFDQDSSPDAEFINALIAAHQRLGFDKICVGPRLVDDAAGELAPPAEAVSWPPPEVSCLATSGMFFSLASLSAGDVFTDDFFLDFVDFEWCWRMRARGWRIYRLDQVPMRHRLGLAQQRFLGLTYHVPAPYRHYFQFRDTLRLLGRSYVPTYAKFRLGLILLPKLILYPFLLNQGMERLRWMGRGIRDALRGIRGPGAASSTLLSVRDTTVE